MELDVGKLKVAELKEYLEKLELDTKGKKAELAERLQAHIDEKKNASQSVEEAESKGEVAEKAEEPEKIDEPEKVEEASGLEVNAEDEEQMDDETKPDSNDQIESEEEEEEIELLPPKVPIKDLSAREKSDIKRKYKLWQKREDAVPKRVTPQFLM